MSYELDAAPRTKAEIDKIRVRWENDSIGKADVYSLLRHIELLEEILDDADGDDYHGTEGWRRHFGGE